MKIETHTLRGKYLRHFNKSMLAQNVRLIGVIKMASVLDIAVRLTDNAVFPLAIEAMKLEILPPGQAATNIIPKAKLGLSCTIKINRKVSAGRTIN